MLAKIGYVLKIFIAVLLLPFNKVRLKNKKIILIGGHEGKLFADNSKVLYNYLLKKHSKEYEIYWIINSNSSDMAEIDRYIVRGSIKNYSYYLLATGIFFSHSASDVAPVIHNYKKTSGISFCLSHGILGLKKLKKAKNMKKGMADRADLFASVSKFEKNIKINDWNLDEKAVRVTGYPRFDDLINKKQEIDVENIILYMPTWREWYSDLSLDSFKKTDYYKEVMELLSNKNLHRLLEKKDFQLHVYVHFYFHRYVSAFEINTKNIKIIEPNFDVQQLLLRSRILITDYSSVCWDFYYLDKPVLFYQFDQTEYNRRRGAYIDLDKDLFGMKSTKLIDLLQHLEITIEQPNRHIDDSKHLKSKYFKYMDNQNCKRIINEFKESIS